MVYHHVLITILAPPPIFREHSRRSSWPSGYGVVTERIRDLLAIENAKEWLKHQMRQAGRRILRARDGWKARRVVHLLDEAG